MEECYLKTSSVTAEEVTVGGTIDLSDIKVELIQERRFNGWSYDVSGMLFVSGSGYLDENTIYVDLDTDFNLSESAHKPLRLEFKLKNDTTTSTTTTTAANTAPVLTGTSISTSTAPVNDETDLPQTGNNSVKTVNVIVISLSSMLIGGYAVLRSGVLRRRDEEE